MQIQRKFALYKNHHSYYNAIDIFATILPKITTDSLYYHYRNFIADSTKIPLFGKARSFYAKTKTIIGQIYAKGGFRFHGMLLRTLISDGGGLQGIGVESDIERGSRSTEEITIERGIVRVGSHDQGQTTRRPLLRNGRVRVNLVCISFAQKPSALWR